MAKYEEVVAQLDALQESVDAKQEALATFIQFLKDQVAEGEAGLTEEQANDVIARAQSLRSDIESTPTE